MVKKILDLVIYADAIMIDENEGESVEDIITYLEEKYPSYYGYAWEVKYEEVVDD